MKKIIAIISLILSAVIIQNPPHAEAAAVSNDMVQTVVTYDEHGGYFVETLENTSPVSNSLITPNIVTYSASSTSVITKTKNIEYYNANNVFCWKYSLTASFNLKKGISAVYKSSKTSLTRNAAWSVVSENHSGSAATATGTIKMKCINTVASRTITIKCDKNGNFS